MPAPTAIKMSPNPLAQIRDTPMPINAPFAKPDSLCRFTIFSSNIIPITPVFN